jgi:hypothetical protein
MRLAESATVSNSECLSEGVMRRGWLDSDSSFLRFLEKIFNIELQMACFGPSLNNSLAKKDAPGQTRHRVQF